MAKIAEQDAQELGVKIGGDYVIVGASNGLYVTFAKDQNGVANEDSLRIFDKDGGLVHKMDFKESFAHEVTDEMLLLIVLERLRIKNEKSASAPKVRAMNGVALALQKLEQESGGAQKLAVHGTSEVP